jgi:hypothetical protein
VHAVPTVAALVSGENDDLIRFKILEISGEIQYHSTAPVTQDSTSYPNRTTSSADSCGFPHRPIGFGLAWSMWYNCC